MVQAVLMGFFIRLFEKPSGLSAPGSHGPTSLLVPDVYIFGAFICIVFLISIFIDHNFFHHGYRMRVAATSLIYRKVRERDVHEHHKKLSYRLVVFA